MRQIARTIFPVIFVVVAIIAIAWWYFNPQTTSDDQGAPLNASGTIETTQISLASELGGEVLEVLVSEGDTVLPGQDLIRFKDEYLLAQYQQALAALEVAEANYELVAAGPTSEERQVAIASADLELINAQQALEELYNTADLAFAQAEQAVALAEKNVVDTKRRLTYLQSTADQTDIDIAKAELALAEKNLERAEEAYEPWANKPEDNLQRAQLLSKKAAAEQLYDAATRKLNALQGTGDELDIALAEANLVLAQEQLDEAHRQVSLLKNGPNPDALRLAEAQLELARSHLSAAKADPSAEQLAVANAQVSSAQAAIEVIRTQIDKLVLKSPIKGVLIVRMVEPGEVVQPGAPLMSLAPEDALTITVYVPEDRYGLITIGQRAVVTVDSYPGEKFSGRVSYIADEAEFTPRNVQTAEGRRTTVFAIRLEVDDPGAKLKPGMPADVVFE